MLTLLPAMRGVIPARRPERSAGAVLAEKNAPQLLSMRSEILPASFTRELSRLRTDVEPMDRDTVLSALRAEYDRPIEEIFDAIDDRPLGSASVAQVHKARLVTGELVAVKIQRPHVQEIMAQDISIMRSLARHAMRFMGDEQFLDLQSVVDELWQSFREETDFLVEARSLEEFRRNNASCAFVDCPKPYPSLCTRHVVVMDYVEGIPINDTARLAAEGYDLAEIGTKLADNYTSQMLDDGFFHADPHPGNLVIRTTDNTQAEQMGIQAEQDLAALGFTVEIATDTSASTYAAIAEGDGDFDILIAPGDPSCWGADPDLLLNWWYGDNVWQQTRTGWGESAEFAQIRELMNSALGQSGDEQQATWKQVYDIIADNCVLYPLVHVQTVTASWADASTAPNGVAIDGFEGIGTTGMSFIGCKTVSA